MLIRTKKKICGKYIHETTGISFADLEKGKNIITDEGYSISGEQIKSASNGVTYILDGWLLIGAGEVCFISPILDLAIKEAKKKERMYPPVKFELYGFVYTSGFNGMPNIESVCQYFWHIERFIVKG